MVEWSNIYGAGHTIASFPFLDTNYDANTTVISARTKESTSKRNPFFHFNGSAFLLQEILFFGLACYKNNLPAGVLQSIT